MHGTSSWDMRGQSIIRVLALDNTNERRYYIDMIRSFEDRETKKIFAGERSAKIPSDLQNVIRRKLRMLDAAVSREDLRIPPSNHLEKLQGDLNGYSSIRVNDKYRIIFKWNEGGADHVRVTDYHG